MDCLGQAVNTTYRAPDRVCSVTLETKTRFPEDLGGSERDDPEKRGVGKSFERGVLIAIEPFCGFHGYSK